MPTLANPTLIPKPYPEAQDLCHRTKSPCHGKVPAMAKAKGYAGLVCQRMSNVGFSRARSFAKGILR